jgi:hypothetical protein
MAIDSNPFFNNDRTFELNPHPENDLRCVEALNSLLGKMEKQSDSFSENLLSLNMTTMSTPFPKF